jgi:octaprenyl-diphosphate synthase
MDIEAIQTLIADDMLAVDKTIKTRLHSEVVLINQIGGYIINSGGKRLRPVLALLSARALGYSGPHHIDLAAIVEFIHTATLLHDDVVDESDLRRGNDTANAVWGNAASVLVGDFLYSRSFEMMVDIDSMRVMEILSRATNIISEGEVLQLMNVHDADTTEERYLNVIRYKTAKLFEAACQLGAVIAQSDEKTEKALASYGMHLGTAFQLVDDVLDYSASADDMGKNIGDDLAEGKPTLPLIYVMRQGNSEQAALVREAIETGGLDKLQQVTAAVVSSGAIEYTSKAARQEADRAIAAIEDLPESDHKTAMIALARFAVERDH